MKICSDCKTVLDDKATYCPRCGTNKFIPFKTVRCVFCNNEIASGTLVCPHCHRILPVEKNDTVDFPQETQEGDNENNKSEIEELIYPDYFAKKNLSEASEAGKSRSKPSRRDKKVAPVLKENERGNATSSIEQKNSSEEEKKIISSTVSYDSPKKAAEDKAFAELSKEGKNEKDESYTMGRKEAERKLFPNRENKKYRMAFGPDIAERDGASSDYYDERIDDTEVELVKKKKELDKIREIELAKKLQEEREAVEQALKREQEELERIRRKVVVESQKEREDRERNSVEKSVIISNQADAEKRKEPVSYTGPTYIYNQIFPNVQDTTIEGAPKISSIDEKKNLEAERRNEERQERERREYQKADYFEELSRNESVRATRNANGALIFFSFIALVGALIAISLLPVINWKGEPLVGTQLAVSIFGESIEALFPSNFNAIMQATYLEGTSKALLASVPYLSIMAIVALLLNAVFILFSAKKWGIKVISLFIFNGIALLAMIVSGGIILYLFNFATVGIGLLIALGLAIFALILGMFVKTKN